MSYGHIDKTPPQPSARSAGEVCFSIKPLGDDPAGRLYEQLKLMRQTVAVIL